MSVTIHEGVPCPDDVMEDTVGSCFAEAGDVEDYLGDGTWLLCWRPRAHGGAHWDDADRVAWSENDAPAAVPA